MLNKQCADSDYIVDIPRIHWLGHERDSIQFQMVLDECLAAAEKIGHQPAKLEFLECALQYVDLYKKGAMWYRNAVIQLCREGNKEQVQCAISFTAVRPAYIEDASVALSQNTRLSIQEQRGLLIRLAVFRENSDQD